MNGPANPDRVLAFRWRDDLDLHRRWGEGSDLFRHALFHARVHGGTTREHNVGVEVLADVNVALHDALVGQLVDTLVFETDFRRLEQGLRRAEALIANRDDLPVGQFVGALEVRVLLCAVELLVEVLSDVAVLLLDVTDNFSFGRGGEGVASFREDFDEAVSEVTPGKIQSSDGVGKAVSLVDWNSVGDTISAVKHDS